MDPRVKPFWFSASEIQTGLDYALEHCEEHLAPVTLGIVADTARGIFNQQKELDTEFTPRDAAYRALFIYNRDHRVSMTEERFDAYIRAFAKMMSERNPKTREKRKRERAVLAAQRKTA